MASPPAFSEASTGAVTTHLMNQTAPPSVPLVVLKVGTSTLMNPETRNPSLSNISRLVEVTSRLQVELGCRVILVTSGAVGFGCMELGLRDRPPTLPGKQAMAAIGQTRLMRTWGNMFDLVGCKCGQLLLTRTDFVHKTRYLNFRNCVNELLARNVIPIVNENDTIATDVLRFGDNDSLAAHVAVLLDAQWLFLLTDVDCLYTADPRQNASARAIPWVPKVSTLLAPADRTVTVSGNPTPVAPGGGAGGGTKWGTGGIITKFVAAQIATAAGVRTVLVNGEHPDRILHVIRRAPAVSGVALPCELAQEGPTTEIMNNDEIHTLKDFSKLPWPGTIFDAVTNPIHTLKVQRRWILSLPAQGIVIVDDGAAGALKKGYSLLAAGILGVKGDFLEDECIAIFSISRAHAIHLLTEDDGCEPPSETRLSQRVVCSTPAQVDHLLLHALEIARGLVTFSSEQLELIKGRKQKEFADLLGFEAEPEVSHRQNIVLLEGRQDGEETDH